jgi:hypothetical protein
LIVAIGLSLCHAQPEVAASRAGEGGGSSQQVLKVLQGALPAARIQGLENSRETEEILDGEVCISIPSMAFGVLFGMIRGVWQALDHSASDLLEVAKSR